MAFTTEEETKKRLYFLMILRTVIITVLMGSAIFLKFQESHRLLFNPLYSLIIATYFLTFVYSLLLKYWSEIHLQAYIQIAGDILIETGAIHFTGGLESPFSFLYILSILAASIILTRQGTFVIATLCSAMYLGLIFRHGFLSYYGFSFPNFNTLAVQYLLYKTFLNLCAFYLVAFLASYLGEKLRQTNVALQKTSDGYKNLESFHREVVENIPSGLVTTDREGLIISYNRAAQRIIGKTLESGKGWVEVFKADKYQDVLEKVISGNQIAPYRITHSYLTISGTIIELDLVFSPLQSFSYKNLGMIIHFQDVTEIRALEKRMKHSERLASIGQLSGRMAHEIRNPLASISGSVQVLREDLKLSDSDKHLMDIVIYESERLNQTVSSFLKYAHPKKPSFVNEDLNALILDIITLLRKHPDLPENLKLEHYFLEDHLILKMDSSQVRQIVWNLCLNSIDAASPDGWIRISTYLDIKNNLEALSSEGIFEKSNTYSFNLPMAYAVIEVSDNGCGIPEENQSKIFDPFFTSKESGIGMGLAIVDRIVESHNGYIEMESKVGKATTFRIYLPKEQNLSTREKE